MFIQKYMCKTTDTELRMGVNFKVLRLWVQCPEFDPQNYKKNI